jgi:hypothetical protein
MDRKYRIITSENPAEHFPPRELRPSRLSEILYA